MNVKKSHHFLKCMIFIVYVAAIIYFMFFADILGRTYVGSEYRYNLVPFKEIKRFLTYTAHLGLKAVLANIVGNVLAFMPFGFCLPMITNHKMKFGTVTLYTFMLSLGIELVQLISRVGCFDVDDLLLNTIGGIAGYLFFCVVKIFSKRRKKENHNENI